MVYAQYVLMGGIAVDLSDLHNTLDKVTLTPDGILYLARHGHFVKISRPEIQDKSKADTLAKALVCVQVLWVVGQAIERKVTGFPITLLEINTIVHVICALVMYCLWFQKPLNVLDPTIIDLGDDRDLLGYALSLSANIHTVHWQDRFRIRCPRFDGLWVPKASRYSGFKLIEMGTGKISYADPELFWLNQKGPVFMKGGYSSNLPELKLAHSENPIAEPILTHVASMFKDELSKEHYFPVCQTSFKFRPARGDAVCRLISGQSLTSGIGIGLQTWSNSSLFYLAPEDTAYEVSFSSKDMTRIRLIASFLERIKYELPESSFGGSIVNVERLRAIPLDRFNDKCVHAPFTLRCENLHRGFIHTGLTGTRIILGALLAAIPTLYGAVHLAALSVIFPTPIERLLWKISCLYLIGSAGCCVFIMILAFLDRFLLTRCGIGFYSRDGGCVIYRVTPWHYAAHRVKKRFKMATKSKFDLWVKGFKILGGTVLGLVLLGYIGARVYIVTESFISLRHVPIGVYQTPRLNIMGNLPHL